MAGRGAAPAPAPAPAAAPIPPYVGYGEFVQLCDNYGSTPSSDAATRAALAARAVSCLAQLNAGDVSSYCDGNDQYGGSDDPGTYHPMIYAAQHGLLSVLEAGLNEKFPAVPRVAGGMAPVKELVEASESCDRPESPIPAEDNSLFLMSGVWQPRGYNEWTVLHTAARYGHAEIVRWISEKASPGTQEMLMKHGTESQVAEYFLRPPLLAVRSRSVDTLRAVLDMRVVINSDALTRALQATTVTAGSHYLARTVQSAVATLGSWLPAGVGVKKGVGDDIDPVHLHMAFLLLRYEANKQPEKSLDVDEMINAACRGLGKDGYQNIPVLHKARKMLQQTHSYLAGLTALLGDEAILPLVAPLRRVVMAYCPQNDEDVFRMFAHCSC